MKVLPEVARGGGEGDDQYNDAAQQLRQAIDTLHHDLMKLEMHLVEQIDVSLFKCTP